MALRVVLGEVLLRPERDLLERGQQRLAAVGQGVGDGKRQESPVDGPSDQARRGEVGEPVWQDRVGDPVDCVVYSIRYTLLMAKTVPVREFRTKLSELLSDVADRRDHVLVTRNGKPAAALVPIDEYEALEETAEILSDSATLAADRGWHRRTGSRRQRHAR